MPKNKNPQHRKSLLQAIAHRPFPLPRGQWMYYQEWNRVLFLHWSVPYSTLREIVPEDLELDTFQGQCYVSLVAFAMEHIRPRFLPAIGWVSNFEEINIRTYVNRDGKKGVYFLSIEAQKSISAWLARKLSGLPYQKSEMERSLQKLSSTNKKGFMVEAEFDVGDDIEIKSDLQTWLLERYCLYQDQGTKLFRYDIHHKEWNIKQIAMKRLHLQYNIGGLKLVTTPDLMHYSEGVKVLAWKKKIIG